MIRLVATDIDGTFLDDQHQFNQVRFQNQLKAMQAQKTEFVVASGNQLAHCLEVFENIQGPISYVVEDGALVIYRNQVVDEHPIKANLLPDLLDYLLNTPALAGVKVILSSTNQAFTNMMPKTTEFNDSTYFYQHLTHFDKLSDVKDSIYKLDIHWVDTDDITLQANQVKQDLSSDFDSVLSGFNGIDITMPHISKAYGLQRLVDDLKINPAEALAFGDTQNDAAMLKWANYGYAMQNATKEAKAATKLVTADDNNHEGVLNTIDQLVLN